MTTARFTVRLDEEQAAWVEAEAEARERSQAWILREAVDLARGADSRLSAPNRSDSVRIGAHRTGVNRTDATDSPALETGEETAPATDAGDDIDDSDDRGDTDGLALEEQGDVIETVVGDVTESWGDSGPRLEDRRDAARAVLRLLFERGQVSKQSPSTSCSRGTRSRDRLPRRGGARTAATSSGSSRRTRTASTPTSSTSSTDRRAKRSQHTRVQSASQPYTGGRRTRLCRRRASASEALDGAQLVNRAQPIAHFRQVRVLAQGLFAHSTRYAVR